MQGIEDPELKSKFNSVVAGFQLMLLITGTVLLGLIFSYLVQPTKLYSGGLYANKMHLIKTYKEGKYDFFTGKKVNKWLSDEFDKYAMIISKIAFNNFVIYSLIVGLNLLNTLLGIIGYMKKNRKLINITAFLSITMTIVFLYYLATLNKQVRQITFSLLNETLQKFVDFRRCSICYKSVKTIAKSNEQIHNMAALSFNVYECCGIYNYTDAIHNDEIPFTCCQRPSYASVNVRNSVDCNPDEVYDGCHKKLSQFMIHKTMFLYVKLFMSILVIFNLFYSLSTHGWTFLFAKYKIEKPLKYKGMKEMLTIGDLSVAPSTKKSSSISNSLNSQGRSRIISTFDASEYQPDLEDSSKSKSATSTRKSNPPLPKNKLNKSEVKINKMDPSTNNLLSNQKKTSQLDHTPEDLNLTEKLQKVLLYSNRTRSSSDYKTSKPSLDKNQEISSPIQNVEKTLVDSNMKITSKKSNFETPGNIENIGHSVSNLNMRMVSVDEETTNSSSDSSQKKSSFRQTIKSNVLDSSIHKFLKNPNFENQKHDVLDPVTKKVSFDTNTKPSLSTPNKKQFSSDPNKQNGTRSSIKNTNALLDSETKKTIPNLNTKNTSIVQSKQKSTSILKQKTVNTNISLPKGTTKTSSINPNKKKSLPNSKM